MNRPIMPNSKNVEDGFDEWTRMFGTPSRLTADAVRDLDYVEKRAKAVQDTLRALDDVDAARAELAQEKLKAERERMERLRRSSAYEWPRHGRSNT